MFDVFDLESDHGSVYRELVSESTGSVTSLVVRTQLPEATVRGVLRELAEDGVVMPLDDTGELWNAERPDLVAARELRRHDDRRLRVHRAESGLMDLYRFARLQHSARLDVELIDDRATVFERFRKLQEGVREQVRAIDRPPYYWDETELARQQELQIRQMSAGISYRTIYQESTGDSSARSESMMRTVSHGENARVLTDPPIKLSVIDDEVGILALDPPAGADDLLAVLLVHRSELLSVLINVFESLWRLAVPINLDRTDDGLGNRERGILTMMASGATDDAIARRLGLSRRTVVRAVGKLLENLGATTRFQAGAQAARRGWL